MKALNKSFFLGAMVLAMMFASCKVERAKMVNETVKDLTGKWQVIKVLRNNADITAAVDLSRFIITFNQAAGTYTLTNQIPFIVYTNGKYSLNDPNVPTSIAFTPQGSTAVTSTFQYPIAGAVRNIIIQFTANPGCTDNSYSYTLQRAN